MPWVIYLVCISTSYLDHEVAALTAFIATIVFCFQEIRRKSIIELGTLIYFSLLIVAYLLPINNCLNTYEFLLANSSLAIIMWASIVLKKPFTIQYAKQFVPAYVCLTPLFKFINIMISSVWAMALSLMAIDNILQSQGLIHSLWINEAITTSIIILAVLFSAQFPDWYKGFLFRKNAKPLEDIDANPFLQGNHAPVTNELYETKLSVKGKIPENLTGIYMRNGPNPEFHPISYTYPLDGDGMIHAIYIKNGKASYRNRFVETKGLMAERRAGRALYGGLKKLIPTDPKLVGKHGDPGPDKNGAFIHIIKHADQYLAMHEQRSAYQLSEQLETIGEWCPEGANTPPNVNAHTRLDPKTGHLSLFTYDISSPHLTYYELDKTGNLIKNIKIDKAHATMMHDFVTTENYILFFDCPAVFDMNALATGDEVLTWRPELKSRIGIMKKSDDSIEWIETEAFWVYHFANAYEKDNQIIVDYIRHQQLDLGSDLQGKDRVSPTLYRTFIDLNDQSILHKQLDTRKVEFPKINEQMNGRDYRYAYMPTNTRTGSGATFNALIKYDLEKQHADIHDFGEHIEIGEAVFSPANNPKTEDDGYLMLFTYHKKENKSEFVILNAQAFTDKPLAQVELPQRVPHGLHGSWMNGQW